MILYNGDCLEIMNEIPDGSVDMVLCDLPYGTTACACYDIAQKRIQHVIDNPTLPL